MKMKMKLKPFRAFKSKLIKPCSKLLSNFLHNFDRRRRSFSLKPSRFRRRHHHRRFRTKVVRFRKPFSLASLRLPRPRASTTLRLRRARIPKTRLRLRRRGPRPSGLSPAPNGERFGEKVAELMSVFRSSRNSNERELELELNSGSEAGNRTANSSRKEPFPSPVTPAFVSRDSVATNAGSSSKESEDDEEEDLDVEDDDVDDEVSRSFESYMAEIIVEDGKVKDLKDVEELLYCWKSLNSPVYIDLVARFYGEVCKELFEEDSNTTTTTTTSES